MSEPRLLVISIPGAIEPLDRGDRFEDPLSDALEKANLGECVGGGTAFTPEEGITGCDIDVEVTDLDAALPIIRDVLTRAEAPVGTTVTDVDSETVCLRITKKGATLKQPKAGRRVKRFVDSTPWQRGEVVAYRVGRRECVLLHVVDKAPSPVFHILDWVGIELPTEKEVRQLVRDWPPTRYRLRDNYEVMQLKDGDRNAGRFRQTGVTVPPKPFPGVFSFEVRRWPEFDRMLKEVFELVRVDERKRLNHALGLGFDHLAVWDQPRGVNRDRAAKLFAAHASKHFLRRHPDRVSVKATDNLKRFVAELKAHFKGTDESPWPGTFSASEGVVIIPVDDGRLAEVWRIATRLGRQHGVTCYDPQAKKLFEPRAAKARR